MLALIDADVILYRVGYTTENDEEWIAKARTEEMLDGIIENTQASEFQLWLSDSTENNFRTRLFPQYKANRTQPRPKHYNFIKEHLITKWGARIAHNMEADDALGIAQCASFCDGSEDFFAPDYKDKTTVICSIDKDLLQIPGLHYNFVRNEHQNVSPWEGDVWFYKQILIGDVSDNIQGCKGIGPVKAGKALDQIPEEFGEQALFEAVKALYQKQEKGCKEEEVLSKILLAGRLLKIKQAEDEELWHFEKLYPMEDAESSSILLMAGETNPSTEPTTQALKNGDGFQPVGTRMDEELVPTPQTLIS